MRLDKFLKVSRIIKRRTLAKEVCDSGRICINGNRGKAGSDLKIGDILEISLGGEAKKYEVVELIESPTKDQSQKLYKEL